MEVTFEHGNIVELPPSTASLPLAAGALLRAAATVPTEGRERKGEGKGGGMPAPSAPTSPSRPPKKNIFNKNIQNSASFSAWWWSAPAQPGGTRRVTRGPFPGPPTRRQYARNIPHLDPIEAGGITYSA